MLSFPYLLTYPPPAPPYHWGVGPSSLGEGQLHCKRLLVEGDERVLDLRCKKANNGGVAERPSAVGGAQRGAAGVQLCGRQQQAPQQACNIQGLRARCVVPCWREMAFPMLPAFPVFAGHGDLKNLRTSRASVHLGRNWEGMGHDCRGIRGVEGSGALAPSSSLGSPWRRAERRPLLNRKSKAKRVRAKWTMRSASHTTYINSKQNST